MKMFQLVEIILFILSRLLIQLMIFLTKVQFVLALLLNLLTMYCGVTLLKFLLMVLQNGQLFFIWQMENRSIKLKLIQPTILTNLILY